MKFSEETRDYISHVSGVVLWVNPLSAYTQMSLLAPRNRVVRFAPLNKYLSNYRQIVRAAAPSVVAASAGAALNRMSKPRYGRATLVQSSSSAPLTGQFDYKTDYARRRKSKRARRIGRRRYKRKRRLLNTIRNSTVASTHLVRRSLFTLSTSAAVSDAVTYGLYGINGTSNDTWNTCDDVASIFKQMDEAGFASANSPSFESRDQKLHFYHGTLEMTIRNTHPTNDALIEAYYVRGRRAMNTNWDDPTQVYIKGFQKQNLAKNPEEYTVGVGGGNTFERQLAHSDVGVTPFQCQVFCQSFNIYKRQKFRIPPGGEINLVLSDSKFRRFGMIESRPKAFDKRYHGIMFQQQGSPDAGGAETPALPTQVTYLATRRYRFKMFRDRLAMDAFDTAATTHGVPFN